MNAPEPDAALREDIRTLGNLLGQSLAQHGGPVLLEAVERIRAAVRDDPAEATRIIDQIDLHEATRTAIMPIVPLLPLPVIHTCDVLPSR